MRHPEVLLLPVFMLLDYYLTIVGASLNEKGYAKHIAMQHYEMNPVWQKQIAQKKWFNPRHLLLALVFSLVFALLVEVALPTPPFTPLDSTLTPFLMGFLLVLFASVLGRHVSNILIFRSVLRDSSGISGHVDIEHGLMLSWSLYQYFAVLLPLALVAIFVPHPFVLGGLAGALMLVFTHFEWLRKHRKRVKAERAASSPPPPPTEPDEY
ncbi:MAG: hypothetical protein IT365_10855 [Candidatus Hydrogenedentes bacterium]|nr:hypothetical protein [Candidatus Hydrogenedentota bacterium]